MVIILVGLATLGIGVGAALDQAEKKKAKGKKPNATPGGKLPNGDPPKPPEVNGPMVVVGEECFPGPGSIGYFGPTQTWGICSPSMKVWRKPQKGMQVKRISRLPKSEDEWDKPNPPVLGEVADWTYVSGPPGDKFTSTGLIVFKGRIRKTPNLVDAAFQLAGLTSPAFLIHFESWRTTYGFGKNEYPEMVQFFGDFIKKGGNA